MRPLVTTRSAVARAARWTTWVALLLGATFVHALTVSPVLVELSPTRRVATVTLSNPGDTPLRFQAQVMAWSQPEGVDLREPSDDLIVAPPIADIPAGGTQVFRVALRRPAGAREQAYRLIFEDISAVTAVSGGASAVNFRVSHDLPVFVAIAGEPKPQPRLVACPGATVGGCVRLVNDGDRYAQVRTITVERGGSRQDIAVNARVLAGAWRQWNFKLPASTGKLRLTAQTADGPISVDLTPPLR